MISDSGHEVDALGHAGEEGRCRPRKSPVSCQTSVDPDVSEWGNPAGVRSRYPWPSEVGREEQTEGIETSQYLQENKSSTRFPE
jgi:hypothetical protein